MFGERLRQAVALRYETVKDAARAMTEAGMAMSYSQLRRYIDGRSGPSLELVHDLAGHLKVRPAWLAAGDGPMLSRISRVELGSTGIATDVAQAALEDLLDAIVAAQPSGWDAPEDDKVASVSSELLTDAAALWDALRLETQSESPLSGPFTVAFLNAVRFIVPGAGQGRPIAEVLAALVDPFPVGEHLEGPGE